MGKKAQTSSMEEINSILQRLKRANELSIKHPPNQAQMIMGRRLGVCFLADLEQDVGNEILHVLNLPTTNQSVPQAFFQTLQSPLHSIPVEWISTWIRITQETTTENSLQAILSFYTWHCQQAALNQSLDTDRIVTTYEQLHTMHRAQLATMLAQAAGSDLVRALLSPIMEAGVLRRTNQPMEQILILEILLRSRWASELTLDTILWHIQSLISIVTCTEQYLSIHWLSQIMEMMTSLDTSEVSGLLQKVVCDLLPHFFERIPPSLQPILAPASQVSRHCQSLTDYAMFHLGTMTLSTFIVEDRKAFLLMVEQLSRSSSKWMNTIRTVMSCIFHSDESLADVVVQLRSEGCETANESDVMFKVLGIFPEDLEAFLVFAMESLERMDTTTIPFMTQNALLLLACGLVIQHESDVASSFVKMLLHKFPHLGISMAPVLLDSLRQGALNGRTFLLRLHFMCESLASDPHCAQEVWNLVGITLSQKDQLLSVRLAAIRMYPTLCLSNRRLYRRVVDSLGGYADERQAEIRLAVVTALCEMSKLDLIRDVSDVIGWLQTFLSDEHSSIVHLSIMSLHYLVVNGELDFSLVIKVLGKRLCSTDDIGKLERLNPLILEALVVLLGDGEVCDEDAGRGDSGLSPQVLSAIQSLVELAESSIASEDRIRINIFRSLAKYSTAALGIDEESIKLVILNQADVNEVSVPEVSRRYVSLCSLVQDALISPLTNKNDVENPVEVLARRITYLEESALGAAIWQKGFKTLSESKKMRSIRQVSKAAVAALPNPEEVYEAYFSDPSASTAIAYLMCYDGKHFDRLADLAGDLSNETLSPMLKLLCVQAWLQAMSRHWSELKARSPMYLAHDLNALVQAISEWSNLSGEIDFSQLACLSLSLYVPDNVRVFDELNEYDVDMSSFIERITTEAEKAFREHRFTDLDIGYLCLAYAGVRSFSSGSNDLLVLCIDTLTSALEERTGSIGLYYGMSVMAQSIPTGNPISTSRIAADRHQRRAWVGEIIGCLIHELQLCFVERARVIVTLVASIRNGTPTPGVLKQIKDLGVLSIQSSAVMRAKMLMISLSSSIQTLIGIHPDIFQALYHLLLKLPLGSGVELVLASVCSNRTSAAALTLSDLNLARAKVLESMDVAKSLYLSAALTPETDYKLWIEENVAHSPSFDMILAVMKFVCSLPVLGTGESSSLACSKLFPHVSQVMISSVLDLLSKVDIEEGVVMRGLLSSTSLVDVTHSDTVVVATAPKDSLKAGNESEKESKLPTPIHGTLLFHIVLQIRLELSLYSGGNKSNVHVLCRLINSLSMMSLPGHFAANMLNTLMALDKNSSELNIALLRLLASQITGRRRAAMDGREFVTLAIEALSIHETNLFENGGGFFLDGLPDLIRKSSSECAERIIADSWELCRYKLEQSGNVDLAINWFMAMSRALADTKPNLTTLHPKTIGMLRRFVVQDVFQSLATISTRKNADALFDHLVNCISMISFEILDEMAFFRLDESTETLHALWKAQCIAALLRHGSFEQCDRLPRILTSLFAWFSRQTITANTQDATQTIAFYVASSILSFDDATTNQVVILLFEAMLVHGHDTIALPLLGLVVNYFGSPNASISSHFLRSGGYSFPPLSVNSIACLVDSVLLDLPKNMESFARRGKTERLLSNRVLLLLNNWQERGAPEAKLLLLQKVHNAIDSASKGIRSG